MQISIWKYECVFARFHRYMIRGMYKILPAEPQCVTELHIRQCLAKASSHWQNKRRPGCRGAVSFDQLPRFRRRCIICVERETRKLQGTNVNKVGKVATRRISERCRQKAYSVSYIASWIFVHNRGPLPIHIETYEVLSS
jgi:hypothetical protein